MTPTVLAISVAYVVVGVLLLAMSLTSRLAWWVKALAIVVTSFFFVGVFFATKSLLGWPTAGALPDRIQLLWVRVVEPDPKTADPGAIYLWIEEVDENNVPSGRPRSHRLQYLRPLADRAIKARDEIVRGNPQQGLADNLLGENAPKDAKQEQAQTGTRQDSGAAAIDQDQLKLLQQAQRVEFGPMPVPMLPPKQP